MNTEYESLDLDGLLELSRSDAEHAGDMAEQARVLREMSTGLKDNVDLMRGVMETLFEPKDGQEAPWSGESSKMMKTELDRLFKPASSAPQVFEDNAKAMDDFSTKVTETLVQIDQLHVRSNGGADEADTKKARQIMQTATSGYLTSANSMPEPEFYDGLRKSSDDAPRDGWTGEHGATPAGDPASMAPAHTGTPVSTTEPTGTQPGQPNQPWSPPAESDPSEPELQGPAPVGPSSIAPPPVTGPAPGPGPIAPTPWAPPATGLPPVAPPAGRPPVGPLTGRPSPSPLRPITANPNPANPWAPRPTNTVPPVIGRPRPSVTPPASPRPIVPRPNGTVPPVIGSRPGIVPPTFRPIPPGPTGTVPPVIGNRPGVVGGPLSRPVVPNPEGTVRPVIGGRPGPGMVPSGRIGPLGPAGSATPAGAAPRPGMGMVPPTGRGMPSAGVLPPGGARTGMAGFPGGKGVKGKQNQAKTVRSGFVGDSELVPERVTNARPVGGLAFAGQSRPTPALAPIRKPTPGEPVRPAKPDAKAATKPAGQRIPRMPRQGGAAVEGAIVRGAQRKPLSRAPGQEVFAQFDAARAAEQEPKKPKQEADLDSEWAIRRVSVPAVITTRKA